jgi:uncharacterized protein YdaU (DUF1376 family)
MEKAMHYYQFNIGDYASHTRHLTNLEDLAYRRLLDAYYLQEHPLSVGITSVARQINMREYETEVKAVLEEFFTLTDEGWFHQRVDKEIKHFQAKRQQASNAGKASAERRNNIRSTDVQPTNNHKPITNNQIDKEYIDRFDEFWKHYPRKVSKPNALKAWIKIKPDDELTKTIISAISKQNLSAKEEQFIPHPASWLNGKRWEDEVKVTSTPNLPFARIPL